MTDITMPDGAVVSFPDDMPKEKIKSLIASKFPEQTKKMDVSAPQAAGASFAHMLPFGTDAVAALGTAIYGRDVDAPFSEKQAAAKAMLERASEEGFEQHPVASFAGGAAGVLAPAMAIPAKAFQGGSALQRALKGGSIAGGMGALWGAGQGNTVDDRITNAITSGAMAVPFGAGGSVAVDAIGSVAKPAGNAARSLAERAKNILDKSRRAGQGSGNIGTAVTQAPINSVSVPTSKIPLTQGQLTQNPKLQALEFGAQAGNYGDEAQRLALETRELQSTATKEVLGNPSDDIAVESAQAIQDRLKSAYSAAKAKTNQAYTKVGEATQDDPLKIAGSYVRETIFPSMKDWLRKGDNGIGFDLNAEGFGEAKKLYQQAELVGKADKLTGMNFSRLEFWRSKVTNRIANTKDPVEKKFLGGLLQRYDNAINNLPREAIKSGDDAIIDMMENARLSRKEQGVLFEKSKLVKDIIQNENLTPEQLANTLTSLGPKTGSYVRDIMRTTKDPVAQTALRQDLKSAILGNALNKSLSSEVRAGSSVQGGVEKLVSFDKLATNLEKLSKNQSLLKQIMPDEAERKAFEETVRSVQLIKSVKPGTKNYSNTAYTLLNYVRNISPSLEKATLPLVGSAGGGLEKLGQGQATLELQKSLAPVLRQLSDEMGGNAVNIIEKYGRPVVSGASTAQGVTDAPLTITVRPSDKK